MVARSGSAAEGRFIALDSLRGLAAVAVVLFHMGSFGLIASLQVFRHAWLMVDFFFVLSGFVIAASYGERLASGFSRSRYMFLRLGRVLPLHAATVLVLLAFELFFVRPVLFQQHDMFYFWRGFLLLDGFAEHTGNLYAPVSWSISVEVMLYLAAAVLFRLGWVGAALAALGAGVSALAIAFDWNHVGFGVLMQRGVIGFSVGVACFALHRRIRRGPDAGWISGAEIALMLAMLWFVATIPLGRLTGLAAYALFGATVLVFAQDRGIVSRALHARPLVWLGTLSYSIYMTHMLLIWPLNRTMPMLFDAAGEREAIVRGAGNFGLLTVELGDVAETGITILLVAIVIAFSALTWRWVEEPARQWSRGYARRWNARREEREAMPA